MKNLLLFILIFAFSFPAQSQQIKGVKSFYKKYKKTEGSVNFVFPGFLVWLGTGIANEMVKEPEIKAGLKLAKRFKTMRLLVMEDVSAVSDDDFNQLVYSVKKNDFEDMITVREKSAKIHIMAKGKNDKLKSLLVLVKEEDSFVMMNMKTNIRAKDLNKFINEIMKSEKVRKKFKEIPEEEKQPQDKEKKKKKPAIRA